MRADPTSFLPPFAHAFCGALLLAVGANALSLPGKRFVGQYDFGYAIRGDRAARPAQVFDDGSGKVYFEARPNQPMPAVFTGPELALLVLQPEGQYFTARTRASDFTLVLGGSRAAVRRGEAALGDDVVSVREERPRLLASAQGGLMPGIAYGPAAAGRPGPLEVHEQPVVFAARSAVLRPEVREALSALVLRIGRDTVITVAGRNDAGARDALAARRADALRLALLAHGVAARNVLAESPDATPAAARSHASALLWSRPGNGTAALPPASGANDAGEPFDAFDIAPADGDIAVSLRRWARTRGYAVDWNVGWVAPISAPLRIAAPSFLDAVQQVVAGLRSQGYPVQAQATADHVVRFTAPE